MLSLVDPNNLFPREARDLDLVREHHHHHHGRALGDSFLALGGGSRDAMGWLGRQLSGARRGGPVTQWALRAGISTHAAVSARFPAWKRHQGVILGSLFGS